MAIKKETLPIAPAGIGNDLKADFTYNELLDELTKSVYLPPLDEKHEVTIEMLAKASGRERQACRAELEKRVKCDGWKRHKVYLGANKQANAYFDPARWTPS